MATNTKERWVCTNPACRREIASKADVATGEQNPRCICGSTMKRRSGSSVFQYLDFLRAEVDVSRRKQPPRG
jgi:hypothetical protein